MATDALARLEAMLGEVKFLQTPRFLQAPFQPSVGALRPRRVSGGLENFGAGTMPESIEVLANPSPPCLRRFAPTACFGGFL